MNMNNKTVYKREDCGRSTDRDETRGFPEKNRFDSDGERGARGRGGPRPIIYIIYMAYYLQ